MNAHQVVVSPLSSDLSSDVSGLNGHGEAHSKVPEAARCRNKVSRDKLRTAHAAIQIIGAGVAGHTVVHKHRGT